MVKDWDFRFKPWGQEPVTEKDRAKERIKEAMEPMQGADEVIVVDPDSEWEKLASFSKAKRENAEDIIICECFEGSSRHHVKRPLMVLKPMKTEPAVAIQVIEEAVKKERGRGLDAWERELAMRCLQAMYEKYKKENDSQI